MRGALRASERYGGQTVLIESEDLGLEISAPAAPKLQSANGRLRDAVDEFTKDLIASTVSECGGNWAEAARRLGLQRGNLHRLATRLRMREAN
jgi:anaerobic nitric oxide reductase transcription regulator